MTPLIIFSIWVQMVLTQANSLRLANQTSTRTFFLPTSVSSNFRWLKFLTRVPRGPLTVTSRPFSLILTVHANNIKNMSNTWVAYHLEKVSWKSSWEANGRWLLGSFQRKISGRNGTSEKVVLFFWTEYSKWKFGFHFFPIVFGFKSDTANSSIHFTFLFLSSLLSPAFLAQFVSLAGR